MNKDKFNSLTKYVADLKSRLTSTTPEKHKNGEQEYRAFLRHEIDMASKKLDAIKLTLSEKK